MRDRQITLKNSQMVAMSQQQQMLFGDNIDTAADTRHDQKFPKILPSINGRTGLNNNQKLDNSLINNNSSLGDSNIIGGVGARLGGINPTANDNQLASRGGNGGDPYNNTMVEFGSIRQS